MAEMLLKRGAKLNARQGAGATPLFHAVYHRAGESVQVLLEAGADTTIKAQGYTPLQLAEAKGDTEMVRILSSFPTR
jgi:ankyrin repeat protein